MIKMRTRKLSGFTKAIASLLLASLVVFTGCNDDDIKDLQSQIDGVVSDVASLKTSVASLQTSVSGMTYIKSITMGTDGKLTITPSTGNPIVYDAKSYVTYDIKLEGNKLYVNGVEKGSVTIPALSFKDGKLMSGDVEVADMSSFFKTALTMGADNFLYINGQKTTVQIPAATVQSVDVKNISISGNTLTITRNDNSTFTVAIPATAITLASTFDPTTGNLKLTVNGVSQNVEIKNTYGVTDGFLTVNGVKTTVAIPTQNTTSVIYQKDANENIISATISDGKDTFTVKLNPTNELLSSIIFVPSWIDNGLNAIEIGYINNIATPAVKSLFTEGSLVYRFNPTTADVSKTTWKFLVNSAKVTQSAPGDKATIFAAPVYTSNTDGSGSFTLKVAAWEEPVAPKTHHLVALEAGSKDFYSGQPSYVVSDYAKVVTTEYKAFIANATKAVFTHFPTTAPAISIAEDFNIKYDDATGIVLEDLVLATAQPSAVGGLEKKMSEYNFNDYTFAFVTNVNYAGLDNVTLQNDFIEVVKANGKTYIKAKGGTASIDREPLIKVELRTKSNNVLIKEGYIKFKIVRDLVNPQPKPDYVIGTFGSSSIGYQAMFKGQANIASNLTDIQATIPWAKMNQVYSALGLTHNEFRTIYSAANLSVVSATCNGIAYPASALPAITVAPVAGQIGQVIISPNAPDVDTYAYTFKATPYAKFGLNSVKLKYTSSDRTKNPDVYITFEFTVTRPTLAKAIDPAFQYAGHTTAKDRTIFTQGLMAGGVYSMQLTLGEAFGYNAMTSIFGAATSNRIDGAVHNFIVTDPYVNGGIASYTPTPASNANLSSLLTTTMKMNPANPLNIAKRVYPVNYKTTYVNGEVDNFDYNIVFVNPLEISLATPNDFTLTDFKTGAADQVNVSSNYVVKMLGQVVVNKGVLQPEAATYGITSVPTFTEANVNTMFRNAGTYTWSTPVATWDNDGTRLTNNVKLADIVASYVTGFASVSRNDELIVVPDATAAPAPKRK